MTWPLVSAHQLTIMFYCSPKHLEIKTFLIKIQRAYYFKLKFKRRNSQKTTSFLHESLHIKHLWPFSKSKFNLKSDRVNLVAPAIPIECLLYLPNVRAIQYKLGPEMLTQLGNSNVLRLPVTSWFDSNVLRLPVTFWFAYTIYKNVTNG